ncbi:MAG: hypothetical protein HYX34_03275 [Actinobacteria bacterium]|nr:hypothetical protein [Actinomycetota bacterium]
MPTGDIVEDLDRWLAATRADAAAESRARERWLRQQAQEEATLAGLLLDLAEREQEVVVQTAGGRRHGGLVRAVADDFLALRTGDGTDLLLRYDGVVAVRPKGRSPGPGDRPRALDVTFAEAALALAAERPRIRLGTRDGQAVAGELRSAGIDVLTVRLDGDAGAAYVPITAVAELMLA